MTETLVGVSPLRTRLRTLAGRGAVVGVSPADPGAAELADPAVPSEEDLAIARELVRSARSRGVAMTGPSGMLKALTKTVIETALDEEMTESPRLRQTPVGRTRQRELPQRHQAQD